MLFKYPFIHICVCVTKLSYFSNEIIFTAVDVLNGWILEVISELGLSHQKLNSIHDLLYWIYISLSKKPRFCFRLHNYEAFNTLVLFAANHLKRQSLSYGDVWLAFKRIYVQESSLLEYSGIGWKISSEMLWLIQAISCVKNRTVKCVLSYL